MNPLPDTLPAPTWEHIDEHGAAADLFDHLRRGTDDRTIPGELDTLPAHTGHAVEWDTIARMDTAEQRAFHIGLHAVAEWAR
jgi:hypothetical protein